MVDEYEKALHEVRQKIDKIDSQILKLLAERFEIVRNVHDIKKAHNLPIKQMGRYQEMMVTLSEKAKKIGLDQRVVHSVWEAIHDTSIKIQEDMDKS
jgi:chorismate mutase